MQREKIKAKYPVGAEVRLLSMDDPQAPPKGTRGVIKSVDDMGCVHVRWENGSNLSILDGTDAVEILDSPLV